VRIPVLLAALALAACGGPAQSPSPHAAPVTVKVVNRSLSPAQVWVAHESAHARLGVVGALDTAEWPIPRSFVEGRDSVGFLAFAGDSACVQKARYQVGRRRHFTVVLRPVFLDSSPGRKKLCNWK
jgi:hypothetical protein